MSYTLKLFIGLLALLALPALSACDTGRGPGEDMEASRGTDTMGRKVLPARASVARGRTMRKARRSDFIVACTGRVQVTAEQLRSFGAGEGIRTLDPNLGKVVLYP